MQGGFCRIAAILLHALLRSPGSSTDDVLLKRLNDLGILTPPTKVISRTYQKEGAEGGEGREEKLCVFYTPETGLFASEVERDNLSENT